MGTIKLLNIKRFVSGFIFILSLNSFSQDIFFDNQIIELDTLNLYTNEFLSETLHQNTQYISCGHYLHFDNNLNLVGDIAVYNFDVNGDLINKVLFSNDSTVILPFHILSKNDKIILAGRIDEIDYSSSNYFVMELDEDLELLSFHSYGIDSDTLNTYTEGLQNIVNSFDSGYISCGLRRISGSTTETEIWISKINDGNLIWETTINNIGLIDVAFDLERNTIEENYILLTEQEELIDPNYDVQHVILLKINEEGLIIDQSENLKTDGSTNNTELRDLEIDQEGNIIFTGWSDITGFVCKLNADFEFQWETTFPYYEDYFTSVSQCVVTADGNYVVAGRYTIPDYLNDPVDFSGFIAKLDATTGDTIWQKQVVHRLNDSIVGRDHYINDLLIAPDGGFVLSGYVFYDGLPQAGWIKKLDANGCEVFNCGLPVNIPEYQLALPTLKAYPNPAHDYIIIPGLEPEPLFFEILNQSGQIVKSGITFYNAKLDIADLSKGKYYIKLENNEVIPFVKL